MLDHLDDVNACLSRAGMITLQPHEPPTPPDSPSGGAGAVQLVEVDGLAVAAGAGGHTESLNHI
jgi:hypothetical protein